MFINPRAFIPQQLRTGIKNRIVRPWQRGFNLLLDIISTEYNFRFRRQDIQNQLEKLRGLPRGLHIEGTNICNAKCTFCAYPQMERPKQTMPIEQFRRIIDEYVAMGGKYVSMTPIVGDPFVDPHIFDRLDDLYRRPQIEGFYFYTNAILMKPDVSDRLMAYGDKLKVHVSMGGFDRETYKAIMGVDQYDRVRRHIEAFLEIKQRTNSPVGFTVSVRCPKEKCTGDLWRTIRKYEVKGLLTIEWPYFGFDSWAGKIKEENLKQVGLEPMTKPYKRGACELLYMKPVVLANGKVNACACRDVEAELIVGDVNRESLADVWESKKLEEIIQRHEQGDFPDVCKRCTWYISVYNKRRTTVLEPLLNWSEEKSVDTFKLY
ncbi:MAG TPA: hypothetical protein DCY88_15310 [Cyanobacteria bacterium UBA11372]|nr:hypothetical protein [Cyanobacteria bacterium UBA11372]